MPKAKGMVDAGQWSFNLLIQSEDLLQPLCGVGSYSSPNSPETRTQLFYLSERSSVRPLVVLPIESVEVAVMSILTRLLKLYNGQQM